MNDTSATQEEVYSASIGDALKRNIFRGFNTTVMAYGQKESGKSYTMYGAKMNKYVGTKDDDNGSVKTADSSYSYNTTQGSYSEDGIVPRAIHDLFMAKDKQATGGDVAIQMTFVEIYNDQIIDLLTSKKSRVDKKLTIRDSAVQGSATNGVTIRGLTSIKLKSTSHSRFILDAALRRKSSASRSHTICTLYVKISPAVKSSITSGKLASMTSIDIIHAKLTLVDLAGTERAKGGTQYNNIEEQRENAIISKDLFVLGQCLQGAAEKNTNAPGKTKHIPYRERKLTRILRDSIGGNCCTIIVACIAPCSKDLDGTLSTLRCAERCRNIVNNVKKNMTKTHSLTPAEGAALRKENKVLKSHVLDMTRKMQSFKRGTQNGAVVFDLEGFQGQSEEEPLETKRLRLKFDKLLQICQEADINTDSAAELTIEDENVLLKHSLEVQELKEQIDLLMRCQQDCGGSLVSGLTMEDEFDDQSFASTVKSFESLLHASANPAKVKDNEDILKKLEAENRKIEEQISVSKVNLIEINQLLELKSQEEAEIMKRMKDRENSLLFINAEVTQSENIISSLRKEENKLKVKVEDFRELIEFSDETIKGKVVECDRVSAQLVSLKKQIKVLYDEKISLVEEIDEYQNVSEVLSELLTEKEAATEAKKSLESATKEVDSLSLNLNELDRKFQIQLANAGAEKEKRIAAEDEVAQLKERVKDLEEKLKKKGVPTQKEELQPVEQSLESRVFELENAIKLQQREQQDQESRISKKGILRDQSNQLSKPPLAKKRKGTPMKAGDDSPANLSSRDDRSVKSAISMSGLLQAGQNKKQKTNAHSVLFSGNSNIEEFNSSFDNQSLMSGAFSIGSSSLTSDQRAIRAHAQKLLLWADKAVGHHSSDLSVSIQDEKENMGNRMTGAFPTFRTPDKRRSTGSAVYSLRTISNDSSFSKCTESEKGCSCKNSIFSGNKEHSEFFLPKLGLACSCGFEKERKKSEDPTALKSFLRSWQVKYLKSIGIGSAFDLVAQFENEGKQMARAMKLWRHSKRMKPARTKSCMVALQIWSKTAKTMLTSHQRNQHAIQRSNKSTKPSFLEITAGDDDVSIMSLDEFENDVLLEGEYEI